MNWYAIENIDEIDSPSLVLYEDFLDSNIQEMIKMVDGKTERLMPHVKTNKMPHVIDKMIAKGVVHFKASTIAEAEMAALQKAKTVLIAHQLVGPKIHRFVKLMQTFPETQFSCLVDNYSSLKNLNETAELNSICISFYIDINNGMNRSGIKLGTDLNELINKISSFSNLIFRGLHVYDGHIHDNTFANRNAKVESGFNEAELLFHDLKTRFDNLQMVSGGTPSFTSHLLKENRICSPGTCVFWDWGYNEMLPEQHFDPAVLIVTRVISKPTEGIITIDLGHKAVASENSIEKRVKFLNLENYTLLSQSEEHGVLKVQNWSEIKIGDVFYGIPYHICPTVNLHDEVSVIKNNRKVETWQITARRRKITI